MKSKIESAQNSAHKEVHLDGFKKVASKRIPFKKMISVFVLAMLVLVLCGLGYLFLNKTSYGATLKLAWQIQKEQKLSTEDAQALDQLKRIMLLPDDINPTMARITDIDALQKEQPEFFANAKNNDRVIIYPDLGIVFNTDEGKIIKIGPVEAAVPTPQNSSKKKDD